MPPAIQRRPFLLTLLLTACGGDRRDSNLDTRPLQALMDQATRQGYPGALLAVQTARSQASLASGIGEVTQGKAMQPPDRFRAGSVLKLLMATVVLQLVEEQRLSLDLRLDQMLPPERVGRFEFRRQITLAQLLNHTSGLGDTATGPEHDGDLLLHPERLHTEQEYLDASLLNGQRPPGQHAYANTNYILLGLIIERSTGISWRQQLSTRLLQRLGMQHSSLPAPEDLAMPTPYAHGYEQTAARGLVDMSHASPSMAGAAGGHALITTTSDLARFAQALFRGELYRSPATLQRMLTFVPGEPVGHIRYAYGLGVMRHELPDGTVVLGHGGSTAGYCCAIVFAPSLDLSIVAARNAPDLASAYLDLALPALAKLRSAML